jgi:hypothetical protein
MPVQRVTYYIKPLSIMNMRLLPFNCPTARFEPAPNGYHALSAKNVPAFHEEPEMPPESEVKQWALVFYEEDENVSENRFWTALGMDLYHDYKPRIKVNDEVKRIAESANEGAKTPDEKLARLVNYCRKNIKNILGDDVTTKEREKAKQNNTTLDTLRRREGTPYEINLAFAALAIADGFDARLAWMSDRGDVFFDKRRPTRYFLSAYDVAVNVDGRWRFYDVANRNFTDWNVALARGGCRGSHHRPKRADVCADANHSGRSIKDREHCGVHAGRRGHAGGRCARKPIRP